ncbi:hypothetical protein Pint_30378 [Pistacia integerrima]|uniref:Uncharacterized protein n=1 Tax=Pistacia integerrima TaxID=434235 RepID=A0ACC0X1C9_9ROSI|nr:hypothetical protein Pint_30378 [Pistacia integerrima]
MESKETHNGDDIPISTSPPLRNEDVMSNSSPNEQRNFDWIVDEVTGEGAVNVNNRMLQRCPSDRSLLDLRHVMWSVGSLIQEGAILPLSWFHVACNDDNKVTRLYVYFTFH